MQQTRDLITPNDGVVMAQPTRHRGAHSRGTKSVRTVIAANHAFFVEGVRDVIQVKKLFCERLSDQEGSTMRRGD
jgi:hypothetical protein